jgi:hypothetical protein
MQALSQLSYTPTREARIIAIVARQANRRGVADPVDATQSCSRPASRLPDCRRPQIPARQTRLRSFEHGLAVDHQRRLIAGSPNIVTRRRPCGRTRRRQPRQWTACVRRELMVRRLTAFLLRQRPHRSRPARPGSKLAQPISAPPILTGSTRPSGNPRASPGWAGFFHSARSLWAMAVRLASCALESHTAGGPVSPRAGSSRGSTSRNISKRFHAGTGGVTPAHGTYGEASICCIRWM